MQPILGRSLTGIIVSLAFGREGGTRQSAFEKRWLGYREFATHSHPSVPLLMPPVIADPAIRPAHHPLRNRLLLYRMLANQKLPISWSAPSTPQWRCRQQGRLVPFDFASGYDYHQASDLPVFDSEPIHSPKFPSIVRDQSNVIGECDGGNHQVIGSYRRSPGG